MSRLPARGLAPVLVTALVGLSAPARAQIAPDCEGVRVPAGYREDAQQAFLGNYFAAAFLLTPLAPPLPHRPGRASLGLELAYLPPLSCAQRLVFAGTKTEDTNLTPINPRPRLTVSLPALGPLESMAGLTVVPPVPTPLGTVLQAGAELGLGWRTSFGLRLGLRGHLDFTRVRAEIATPVVAGDPPLDDLFFASSLGADLGLAYALPWEPVRWLTPFASLGLADVSTLTVVGDDLVVVQNLPSADGQVGPWWGLLAAAGLQALLLDEHLELGLELSSAVPVFTTVKARIAVVW